VLASLQEGAQMGPDSLGQCPYYYSDITKVRSPQNGSLPQKTSKQGPKFPGKPERVYKDDQRPLHFISDEKFDIGDEEIAKIFTFDNVQSSNAPRKKKKMNNSKNKYGRRRTNTFDGDVNYRAKVLPRRNGNSDGDTDDLTDEEIVKEFIYKHKQKIHLEHGEGLPLLTSKTGVASDLEGFYTLKHLEDSPLSNNNAGNIAREELVYQKHSKYGEDLPLLPANNSAIICPVQIADRSRAYLCKNLDIDGDDLSFHYDEPIARKSVTYSNAGTFPMPDGKRMVGHYDIPENGVNAIQCPEIPTDDWLPQTEGVPRSRSWYLCCPGGATNNGVATTRPAQELRTIEDLQNAPPITHPPSPGENQYVRYLLY
jgi:hypothetical protein